MTLASAIKNLRAGWFLDIRIIDCGLEHHEEIVSALSPLQRDLDAFRIRFYPFDADRFEKIAVVANQSYRSAYAYLTLAGRFPDLDKALFLDADLIVHRDLSNLWETPLGGYPLAAVRDPVGVMGRGVPNCTDLGIDPGAGYFNSGVLYLNLRYWRQHEIEERVFAHLINPAIEPRHYDQTFLNVTLAGNWKELPRCWNRLALIQPGQYPLIPLERSIFHLASRHKPWHFAKEGATGMIRLFYSYLDQTDWRRFGNDDVLYQQHCRLHQDMRRCVRFYLGESGLNPLIEWLK